MDMPDSIDLARYSVFTPPDPFEDHTGPFYFRIHGDASKAGTVHCVLPTEPRHGNYAGGVHGGAILAFADYALCLVAGRAADGGTNTSFAMTVSIAVEFLSAGRIGVPLEATGEPLQVTGRLAFARGSITQQGKTVALWSGVVRHVARDQGHGPQGRGRAGEQRRAGTDRARGLRAADQRQRLFAPHRTVLCAQGSRRRDDDPADPAAHVQLGRRAAWRLHDELRQFGGDARRRRRHRHGAEHGVVRRRVPRRRIAPPCRWSPGSRCRATAADLAFLRGLLEQDGKPLLSYSATIFLRPKA